MIKFSNINKIVAKALVFLMPIYLGLSACGGADSCKEPPPRAFTTAQIRALSAADMPSVTDLELISFGTDIQYMTSGALGALKDTIANTNIFCTPHNAQIQSITPAQIAVLSPAQVRTLGSSENGISKISKLSTATFTKLVSSPAQVAAITVAENATFKADKFMLIGINFAQLTDLVLASLKETYVASPSNSMSHIQAITADQIASLTPTRVRLLGSGQGGVSKIAYLNESAFAKLVSDPLQVAAMTAQEYATFNTDQLAVVGANFGSLSNSILASLNYTYVGTPTVNKSQIASITPDQIASLTPAKVRILGSFDNGVSKINYLANNTFLRLASDPLQVVDITPAEIDTLFSQNIKNLGLNINSLTDAAIGALNYACVINVSNPQCQVQSIDPVQVPTFSQNQIMVFAGMNSGKGISNFSTASFGALTPGQVTLLLPANVTTVTAAQLGALSNATLAAFPLNTISSFTTSQKSQLNSSQHTACGC